MFNVHLPAAALLTAVALFATQAPALAQDAHHPPGAGAQATPAPAPAPQAGQTMPGGQGMMGMMGGQGMMGQGGMMGGQGTPGQGMMGGQPSMMEHHRMMMGMMGRGMSMGMTDHIEGRIAFLRAELKITTLQQQPWDGFAEALRANAKKHGELHGAGMVGSATLQQRLAQREKSLAARLDGLRGMNAAYDRLAAVLNDEQKKLAEELIPPHVGLMPGMMM